MNDKADYVYNSDKDNDDNKNNNTASYKFKCFTYTKFANIHSFKTVGSKRVISDKCVPLKVLSRCCFSFVV
jgi:hypothetical protein